MLQALKSLYTLSIHLLLWTAQWIRYNYIWFYRWGNWGSGRWGNLPKDTQEANLGSGLATRLKHMKSHYLTGFVLLIQQLHWIQPRSSQIHSLSTMLSINRFELAFVKYIFLDSNQKEWKGWGKDVKPNHREQRRAYTLQLDAIIIIIILLY